MRALFQAVLAAGVLFTAPAFAQDDEEDVESVVKRRAPAVEVPETSNAWAEAIEEFKNRPHPPNVYRASEQLGLDVEYAAGIHQGLELIYRRDYRGARDHFDALEGRFTETGVSAVAQILVYQAMMLENFDMRYDKQYEVASKRARADVNKALGNPGNEGWEHFLMAGIAGIEAIHTVRKQKYLPALQLAFEAMDHVSKSKAAAPDYVDLILADGMYNYWRTVLTLDAPMLPDFGDHRAEGIEQMTRVEIEGPFLAAPATLALAFTWIEEREFKRALSATLKNQRAYPENVVNNLMLGQVQTYLRKYDPALETYDRVLETSPKNNRVHYWRGVTLLKAGRVEECLAAMQRYLESDYLEDWQKSSSYYRIGQAHYRLKAYRDAEAAWQKAVKIDGHKGSKASLDKMVTARKEGRITY